MGVIFGPFVDLISLVVNFYFVVVVLEIALHWLIHFKILSVNNPYSTVFLFYLSASYQLSLAGNSTMILRKDNVL